MNKFLKRYSKTMNIFIALLCLLFLFAVYILYDNFHVDVEQFEFTNSKIPQSFDGYKIAHVSDFHNRKSDVVQNSVLESLNSEKPDAIFVTGDFIDCRTPNLIIAYSFMEKLVEIAPVYYVMGNHECNYSISDQNGFDEMIIRMEAIGATIIRQENIKLYSDKGDFVTLYGLDEPYFSCEKPENLRSATIDLCEDFTIDDNFNILLAHHPEQFDVYSDFGFDLVFSGHAHGGQGTLFGLPLFAPDQGYFPEFTSGIYKIDGSTLVLSRGLGYSTVNFRMFCPPHLVYVNLKIN